MVISTGGIHPVGGSTMKNWRLILSVLICAAAIGLCYQIISVSVVNQKDKQDSAEIHHIKYGLFSINEWKRQLSVIISEEITKLDLSASNQKELKKHVEIQLDGLIDNVEKKIKDTNKQTAKGRMKQFFINNLVDIDDIKEGIPDYADAIIEQMTKVKTENTVKDALKSRVDGYFEKTFESQDETALNRILLRTQAADIQAARELLGDSIHKRQNRIFNQTWVLIALAAFLFLIVGSRKAALPASEYMLMILMLLILLTAGVTVPMIDMEAKISALKFTLLDHPVSFENQVLYFQTKSILDVFWIMITHEDFSMKVVGILMVAFSIVFPLLKMLSSLAFYYDFRKATHSWWIKFFVLKSGKWSMTDVLIVAIFMAYVGFNGIITSQFGSLNTTDQEVVILTTNGTSLQPGFFIFLTYTVLALFLSGFLTREIEAETK